MSELKAVVVVDNIAHDGIKGEWGLCVHIDYKGKKILLDTGATNLFAKNAEELGIELADTDFAVLSHAHYDHSGGMEKFFETNENATFYIRDTCDDNCYFKKFFIRKYIGIPKGIRDRFSHRITPTKDLIKITDGVFIVPHNTPELGNVGKRENMYRREKDGWHPDDFSHEQSLVFETEKSLVIFNSCSHGGAVNIINETAQAFPGQKVYGLIGGFHLHNKPENEVRELGRKIKETGIEFVCTGHCTGDKAYRILKEELGDTVHQLHVGLVMEF